MNDPHSSKTFTLLALAGTLPFVAGAALLLAGINELVVIGSVVSMIASYGLGIISFITGIHWGTQLFRPGYETTNLYITSNVVFLLNWFAYLTLSPEWILIVQILTFLGLLFIDFGLMKRGALTMNYWKIRRTATTVACLSLSAAIVSMQMTFTG